MKRLLGSVAAAFLLLPLGASAWFPGSVVISEVGWAGSAASTADEWLELFNSGSESADLTGWKIEGAGAGGASLTFPDGSIIAATGTFLVANYSADDPKSTLASAPDWVTTSVSLPNEFLHLVLRDAAGNLVDEAGSASSAPPAGVTGERKSSMERLYPFGEGELPASWATATASIGFDSGANELGTPGSFETSAGVEATAPVTGSATETATVPAVESASDTTDAAESAAPADGGNVKITTSVAPPAGAEPVTAVRISEAYPRPKSGETEWVELVNPSSVGEILDGWWLENGRGYKTPLGGLIAPWSRALVESPKGHLSDDGDLILFEDARGRILDGVSYGKREDARFPHLTAPERGESLMRFEYQDAFAVTAKPTPGEPNVFVDPSRKITAPKAPAAIADSELPAVTPTSASPVVFVPVIVQATSTPAVKTDARGNPPKSAVRAATKKYKGEPMSAVIAVPPGVYGKTKSVVIIDDRIMELRLNKAPASALAAGQPVKFIAQEKDEAGGKFLTANVNSIALAGEPESFDFAAVEAWPEKTGAYSLAGVVVSTEPGALSLKAGGTTGTVRLPSGGKPPFAEGDVVRVAGFIDANGSRSMYVSGKDSVSLIEPAAAKVSNVAPPKLPWPVGAIVTIVIGVAGVLAYLRQERLKRLAMTRADASDDFEVE